MVQVNISGIMRKTEDSPTVFEVEAKNIRQLLVNLEKHYPEMKPHLDKGVAVSVDGTIYRDNWFQSIQPDSEVYLVPRLAGG
ncbi:MAG: MoaD/ThiS family protein [Rhodospirillales bacterium]|jgi:molybdopterin converting factor small subunit|nr:MoaD/ThiS family protein [Rhodospirillales bacterium]MBT4041750.1 MoaD/ThiS family protein [Rhodospirillales bacterium]MBT4627923.1 MoaD/ThiS family protein [Rhodospirillales bacterium]MBT5350662.1 MoaD/ThiS family protein [Rhodospirillales bacterium]MBT5520585.1 MoaD/ThiS family protein [Rhodospirillales bacterium]